MSRHCDAALLDEPFGNRLRQIVALSILFMVCASDCAAAMAYPIRSRAKVCCTLPAPHNLYDTVLTLEMNGAQIADIGNDRIWMERLPFNAEFVDGTVLRERLCLCRSILWH